ncbi:MAG: ABC transporter ATP-binding protein [Chloroflexi bacterium]|nr:ABC transporter ATP-binding protein [Chloroflexota bacterium]
MIEFSNIEIKYGNFVAIQNLNLEIQRGEFFTFLGPSGCGKTTTLRCLVGFIRPARGTIQVDHRDITNAPVEKREIGMVFQSYALFPTMNVFENIAFGLRVKKLSKAEVRQRVFEIARKIDLSEEQLFKNVSQLSGGQQQRVALARAMIMQPKIICLDEPLSNLDAKLRIGLRGELKKLQRDLGITTLYVTHDQEEALTLSDRLAVFNNGQIEQVGTPFEIYNKSASRFVCEFIGDINNLSPNVIREINAQSSQRLDPEKEGFVRLETISLERKDGFARLSGIVKDSEYDGVFTKYHFDVMGQTIKSIEKNDGVVLFEKGGQVDLFINPATVMQY